MAKEIDDRPRQKEKIAPTEAIAPPVQQPEEDDPPTSPVTASQEVQVASPEDVPDEVAETPVSTDPHSTGEDPPPGRMSEDLPPGVTSIAVMPPPA